MADFLLALNEIGPRVWLIGSAPSEETASLFDGVRWQQFSLGSESDLVAMPEVLTPMLAALPVQLLAEFLATARGTNADSFRADQEAYQRAGAKFRI